MRTLYVLLLAVLITPSCSNAQNDEVTTIFLVRHAEAKFPPYQEDPPDPDLNNAGRERALELKRIVQSVGLTEIFSSDRKRAQQTAMPIAEFLSIGMQIYDRNDLQPFAELLKTKSGRILVSGHSNTTPELVELLGGDPGEPINEQTQFDRIYVVNLLNGRAINTLLLKYGVNYD